MTSLGWVDGSAPVAGIPAWALAALLLNAIATVGRNLLLGPGIGDLALHHVVDSSLSVVGGELGGGLTAVAAVTLLEALIGGLLGAIVGALRRAMRLGFACATTTLGVVLLLFQLGMSMGLPVP